MVSVGAKRSTRLSRVTLVGERRRIDLVLPSDEPVGSLLPEVLSLLGDEVSTPPVPRHLVTAGGTVLPQDSTLAAAQVADGAVLRLVRAKYTPAAPVVHDVTDEVADDLDLRAWRWRPAARRWTAGASALSLSLITGLLAWDNAGSSAVAPWLLAAAVVALAAGAAAAGLGHRNRGLGTTLIATGGALGACGVWALSDAHGWPTAAHWGALIGAGVVSLAALGAFSPVGRGGLVGAGVLALTAMGWEVAAAMVHGAHGALDQSRLGALLGVTSVVALGMLPRCALVAAGLTRLDDRRAGGASVSRYEVGTALAAAHRGLSVAALTIAASACAAGWLLLAAPSRWTVPTAVVLAVVLISRARAFPLVAEVVALQAAALVLLVRLVQVWLGRSGTVGVWPVLLLAAVVVVPLVVLAVEPPEHVRVRLRRAMDVVEALGVVVLFPLAVGVFGLYQQLLGAF